MWFLLLIPLIAAPFTGVVVKQIDSQPKQPAEQQIVKNKG